MNHVICDTGNTWTERCTVNESRLSNEFLMMIFFHFFVNKVLLFYHLPRILALEIVARIFVELFQLSLKVLSQDFAFDWRPGDVCNWEFALNRCKGRWKTRHRGQPISSTPASPANAWLEPRTTSEWCSPATSAPDLATAPDPETDSQAVQSTFTAPWASNKPAVPGPPTHGDGASSTGVHRGKCWHWGTPEARCRTGASRGRRNGGADPALPQHIRPALLPHHIS